MVTIWAIIVSIVLSLFEVFKNPKTRYLNYSTNVRAESYPNKKDSFCISYQRCVYAVWQHKVNEEIKRRFANLKDKEIYNLLIDVYGEKEIPFAFERGLSPVSKELHKFQFLNSIKYDDNFDVATGKVVSDKNILEIIEKNSILKNLYEDLIIDLTRRSLYIKGIDYSSNWQPSKEDIEKEERKRENEFSNKYYWRR